MIQILTHRGLEPTRSDFYSESTLEAFTDHLERGYGVELDANFTQDGIVIFHDPTLSRMTSEADARRIAELTTRELLQLKLPNGRLATFAEIAQVAQRFPNQTIALHFKGGFQTETNTDRLVDALKEWSAPLTNLLVIDVTPHTAQRMKRQIPELHLAASVAHPYDIQRYNGAIHGTLMTMEELLKQANGLYTVAWLDEWDLSALGENGQINPNGKRMYTPERFKVLREHGFKISLVTPELHGTSPGLLGGEAHPDAKPLPHLLKRIEEIVRLKPDYICTDHPEETKRMIQQLGI
jgi:glycerophosphoryl diester phosphodiesterase